MTEDDLLFLLPLLALLFLVILFNILTSFYMRYRMHKNMLEEWKFWEEQL